MKIIVRAFAALVLAQAVHAQTQAQVPALKGPAIAELEAASENSSAAAARLDGAKAKPASDGTVVVGSKHETYVRDVPASRECDYDGGAETGDGRMRPYHSCVRHPAYRERVEADVETVRVADRKAFTASRERTGALIGGAIGLLGFFALFAGPIGWAIGAATVVAGAAIGAGIGYATAKGTPDTFTRTKERSARPL